VRGSATHHHPHEQVSLPRLWGGSGPGTEDLMSPACIPPGRLTSLLAFFPLQDRGWSPLRRRDAVPGPARLVSAAASLPTGHCMPPSFTALESLFLGPRCPLEHHPGCAQQRRWPALLSAMACVPQDPAVFARPPPGPGLPVAPTHPGTADRLRGARSASAHREWPRFHSVCLRQCRGAMHVGIACSWAMQCPGAMEEACACPCCCWKPVGAPCCWCVRALCCWCVRVPCCWCALQGVLLLYHRVVQPVLTKHEAQIDKLLHEVQTRGKDLAMEQAQKVAGRVQTALQQGHGLVKNQYQVRCRANQYQVRHRAAPGCGLRAAGCGLRAAGCGLRAAGCGLRAAGCGLRAAGWQGRPRPTCHHMALGREQGSMSQAGLCGPLQSSFGACFRALLYCSCHRLMLRIGSLWCCRASPSEQAVPILEHLALRTLEPRGILATLLSSQLMLRPRRRRRRLLLPAVRELAWGGPTPCTTSAHARATRLSRPTDSSFNLSRSHSRYALIHLSCKLVGRPVVNSPCMYRTKPL